MTRGPSKDPNALRRDRPGDNFTLRQLSRAPYAGPVPHFPLPAVRILETKFEDKRSWQEYDADASDARAERESELWAWAWQLPQAAVWAEDPWRLLDIAMWVRTQAICESIDATAADKGSLHVFARKIGLGPDGLKENCWSIARDEVAQQRADVAPEPVVSAKSRLRAV